MLNLIYRLAAPSLVRACVRRALFAATAFISSAATAQAAERDPLNAQAVAPRSPYQSAFSAYQPYQDPELMPWKTANDVVRKFGGMAGMGGVSEGENSDPSDAKPGGSEQANSHPQPAPDMSNMKSGPPAPASKKPASSSKPEMKNMPGHDMSKMQSPKPKVNTPKVAPASATKDKREMTDMPGHDMSKMQKTPAVPANKSTPAPAKPAAPAPMPGHGGMVH